MTTNSERDSGPERATGGGAASDATFDDRAADVADGVRWALEKGEQAAAIALGLTILGVNRLQVQRRELSQHLFPKPSAKSREKER